MRETTPADLVLVVDDHEMMRDLLVRNMKFQGLRVETAVDGAAALEFVSCITPDLILLDMMMPHMSGIEVLERLKANSTTASIPVLVLSADSDMAQIVHCIELGAEDYLVKPFNSTLLQARVAACLEKRHLRLKEAAYQRELEARIAERTALAEQRAAALAASEEALMRQANVLQSILQSMGDGVVVVDTKGDLVHHNPAARTILGARFEAFLPGKGATTTCFQQPDHKRMCTSEDLPLARAIRGSTSEHVELYCAGLPDAQQWISVTSNPLLDAEQAILGGVAVIRDISAAKRAEMQLRVSEERYALAARGANDGLWDWDVPGAQIYFSPRWKHMLGYSEEEVGTDINDWLTRVHPADREQLETRLNAHRRRLLSHFEHEYRILHRNGEYRWMLCRGLAVWDSQGEIVRMAGSQTDITDRKTVEQQLLYDAFHDPLTGLPNRALFIDRLDQVLARLRRSPQASVTVLFLDLDRFKVINDSLGHAAGDQLLKVVAARLRECVRPSDTVARLAGDEFTVLIEDSGDASHIDSLIERIQHAIAHPVMIGDTQMSTNASIGVLRGNGTYQSASDMVRDADIAMYQAKMMGKARVVKFDTSMHVRALERLQLENELRRAIDDNQLRVFYQPIVALADASIAGVEALVRWQHPTRGLLTPADFLTVAEESGLIVPLSWWTLRESCAQMHAWQGTIPGAKELWISVNLSSRQLAQPDMLIQLQRVLRETGLAPQRLKLEITEYTLLEYGDATLRTLDALRELGIQLCIDDFGTGYSSLSYLQRFPVDVLKIDRSFINQLGEDQRRSEIVHTILGLARTLGLQVVAEGTETIQQVSELQRQNCDFGQGWLFSRAVDAAAAASFIQSAPSFDLQGVAPNPDAQAA